MINKIKKITAALAIGLLTSLSASANSLTYQGVTFNTWAVDSDTLGLSILNATQATGNWAGIGYLSAFEIKGIGGVSFAQITSGPGFTTNLEQGLNANVTGAGKTSGDFGCVSGGTPGACFFSTPAVALASVMTWTIDFGGTDIDFSAPHLKVQFLTNLYDTSATGDLLSQNIAPIPEPETYAMMLAGLGLMMTVVRRRTKR